MPVAFMSSACITVVLNFGMAPSLNGEELTYNPAQVATWKVISDAR